MPTLRSSKKKNEILNKQQAEQETHQVIKEPRKRAKQYGKIQGKSKTGRLNLIMQTLIFKTQREINDNEKYMKEAESSIKRRKHRRVRKAS